MSLHLPWLLIPAYMALAAVREMLAVLYYKYINEGRGLAAGSLSFLIEIFDMVVLVIVVIRYMADKDILLGVTYALGGAIGVFVGVRMKKK